MANLFGIEISNLIYLFYELYNFALEVLLLLILVEVPVDL